MCEEKCVCNSLLFPVIIFTTPAGRSDVASTSANVMADKGNFSEAYITQVFPPAITGAKTLTNPKSALSSGAMIDTTPVGSGTEKL